MVVLKAALTAFVGTLASFLSTNLLLAIAASPAAVVSIVAPAFVMRRNTGPASGPLAPGSA